MDKSQLFNCAAFECTISMYINPFKVDDCLDFNRKLIYILKNMCKYTVYIFQGLDTSILTHLNRNFFVNDI